MGSIISSPKAPAPIYVCPPAREALNYLKTKQPMEDKPMTDQPDLVDPLLFDLEEEDLKNAKQEYESEPVTFGERVIAKLKIIKAVIASDHIMVVGRSFKHRYSFFLGNPQMIEDKMDEAYDFLKRQISLFEDIDRMKKHEMHFLTPKEVADFTEKFREAKKSRRSKNY